MGQYWEREVKCPFFKREDKKTHRISCEGVTHNTTISLVFGEVKEVERKDYLWHYCCRDYERCEIFKAVSKKYE